MNQTNLYTQLEALPINMTVQIINGRLITMPRPAGPHILVESALGMKIDTPYQYDSNGPDPPRTHRYKVVPDWVCEPYDDNE